jgi:putative tryptophan/tyrosine transport system substrate-binding protein
MRRRQFIAGLGGAAAWPLAARAQQTAMPVIGFLSFGPRPAGSAPLVRAFWKGLGETGYIEGRNVMINSQSAENLDRLRAAALGLVRRRVSVIVTVGSLPAMAAKAASATIPIVFRYGGDPVTDGLVASLNRPGGNVTGVTGLSTELTGKRFELLHEMVPAAKSIGFLIQPSSNPTEATFRKEAADRASTIFGTQLEFLMGGSPNEIEAAFATLNQKRITALVVQNSPFFFQQFGQLVSLAARYAVPAIYHVREAVDAGGLMSYGPSFADDFRLLGVYAGRILKGEKPAELPVQQSARFELIINRKTAKALGLEVPPTLLATADQVID